MLVRRVARPLLASVFIAGGIDQLRRPADKAAVAAPLLDAVQEGVSPTVASAADAVSDSVDQAADAVGAAAEQAPVADGDPHVQAATGAAEQARAKVHDVADGRGDLFADETLVRVNGAVQLTAGLLLAGNKVPRLASTALAATLVPTTLGGHRWWEAEGTEREIQRFNFLKNVALLGGLVLAAADTEGQPGLAWRLRRGGADAKLAARAAKANAAVAAHAAALDARATKRLARANAKAAGKAGALGVEVAGHHARSAAGTARRHADHAGERANELAVELAPKIQAAGHTLADRAAEVAADLSPRIQAAGHTAADRAAEMAPRVQAVAQRVSSALPTH